MKTLVGYSFTEAPIQRLKQAGFDLVRNDETLEKGYREFIIPFSESIGLGLSLEFREILDEELYFQFQNKREFDPHESESKKNNLKFNHANDVRSIAAIYGENLPEGELKDYLKLRKVHSLWLVILKCQSDYFFKNKSVVDRYFNWNEREAALIHLGQSCFDLLIIKE